MLKDSIDADKFVYQTALIREQEEGGLTGWELFILLCEKNPWFEGNTSIHDNFSVVNLELSDKNLLDKLSSKYINWRTNNAEGGLSMHCGMPISWWLNYFYREGVKPLSPAYFELGKLTMPYLLAAVTNAKPNSDIIKTDTIPIGKKEAVANDKKELSAIERLTLLKIVISMAKDGYGYDHNQLKSPLPLDIQKASELYGVRVSDDTIRKWLKEAASILP